MEKRSGKQQLFLYFIDFFLSYFAAKFLTKSHGNKIFLTIYSGDFYFESVLLFLFIYALIIFIYYRIRFPESFWNISSRAQKWITGGIVFFFSLFLTGIINEGCINDGCLIRFFQANPAFSVCTVIVIMLFLYPVLARLFLRKVFSTRKDFYRFLGYLLASLIFAAAMVLQTRKPHYDADVYAVIADIQKPAGFFTFKNLPDHFRGLHYPFMLMAANKVLSLFLGKLGDTKIYSFFISILYCFSVWIALEKLWGKKNRVSRHGFQPGNLSFFVIILIISGVIWKDLFSCPLSDAPAFSTAILCLWLALKIYQNRNGRKISLAVLSFDLGFLIYFLYNTRPAYILTSAIVFLLLIFLIIKSSSDKKQNAFVPAVKPGIIILIICFSILAGILTSGYPQAYNNRVNGKGMTIFLVQEIPPYESLSLAEVNYGLQMSRYDTFIGPRQNYFNDHMVFTDNGNQTMYTQFGQILSYKDFFSSLLHHPMDWIGLYARHIFALLFLIFKDQAYIRFVPEHIEWELVLFCFFDYYFCISDFLLKKKNGEITKHVFSNTPFLFLIALLLSAVPAVLSVEVRYGFPIYFATYLYLCCYCSWKKLFKDIKEHWVIYLVMFCITFAILCAQMGVLAGSLQNHPMLMN